MYLLLFLLVSLVLAAEHTRLLKEAFMESCRDGNVPRINVFINDIKDDKLVYHCLEMQKDHKEAYLAILSSERFVLIHSTSNKKIYPVYHGVLVDQVDSVLNMLHLLYTGDFKKLAKRIYESPSMLKCVLFQSALTNQSNKQYPISLSLFVDYCALHGRPDVIHLLRYYGEVEFGCDVPAHEGETAFYYACEKGDLDMFVNLIVSGLVRDPSTRSDRCGKITASPEIIKALLYYPGTNAGDILNTAVVKGRYEVVLTILEHRGFFTNRRTIRECELLASTHNHADILGLLDEYMRTMFDSSSNESLVSSQDEEDQGNDARSYNDPLRELATQSTSRSSSDDQRYKPKSGLSDFLETGFTYSSNEHEDDDELVNVIDRLLNPKYAKEVVSEWYGEREGRSRQVKLINSAQRELFSEEDSSYAEYESEEQEEEKRGRSRTRRPYRSHKQSIEEYSSSSDLQ